MLGNEVVKRPVAVALRIDPSIRDAMQQIGVLVEDILLRGLPLSVSVQSPGGDQALLSYENLCRLLRDVALRCGTRPRDIELVIDATRLRVAAAWFLRLRYLGPGPLGVRVDAANDEQLDGLWQLRRNRWLRPAYAPRVLPQSPLLSNETADAILPGAGVQVPAGTAWIAIEIDILSFADPQGRLRWTDLKCALNCCVDEGERLHDDADWPTATMRHDAWLHRRLAIVINRLGCLVRRRRENPRSIACLERLEGEVREALATLRARSQSIGLRRGYLPAFDLCDPTRKLERNGHAFGFKKRWRQAVDGAAVRHRNLFVLSPWSVFPEGAPADLAYADLLPVVTHADACSFRLAPDTSNWKRNQFRDFHRHASAVIAQTELRRQIAEQV